MQKNRERLQFNNRPFSNNLDNEDTVGRDDDEGNNDDDCHDLLKLVFACSHSVQAYYKIFDNTLVFYKEPPR